MRSASKLLAALNASGVKIWAERGDLHFHAPRGVLSPQLMSALRAEKSELIELLSVGEPLARIPIKRRNFDGPVPLTAMQRRLWLWIHDQCNGRSSRQSGFAVRVAGPLDLQRLRHSVETVVQRHEALRARFIVVNSVPRQHMIASCECEFHFDDFSRIPRVSVEMQAKRTASEFLAQEIDICAGPLLACQVLKISPDEHVFVMALNHLITDGHSSRIINSEIWAAYHIAEPGQSVQLPNLGVQFGDYAVWQQETYGAWLEMHRAYWTERTRDMHSVFLTPDVGLMESSAAVGALMEICLGMALTVQLRALARRENTLLPLVLLTVYSALVAQWVQRQDLLVTFSMNGRYWPELESVVGWLSHPLVLRIQVSANDSFLDLLRKVILEFSSAYDHRDFGRLHDFVPVASTDLYFNWLPAAPGQESDEPRAHTPDRLKVSPFPVFWNVPAKFSPFLRDSAEGLTLTVLYGPDMFTAQTIRRFVTQLSQTAEQFVTTPLARVGSLATPRDSN